MQHDSDTNTYIGFLIDEINLYAGGIRILTLDETSTQDIVVINQNGVNVDFKIESLDKDKVFFTDAAKNSAWFGAGIGFNVVEITASRTQLDTDCVVLCYGTITYTLKKASSWLGKTLWIKNFGTGVITIDGDGSETIDEALTHTLSTHNDAICIEAVKLSNHPTLTGYHWVITSSHP